MTYRGQGQPMEIGKSDDNFKDERPKCFNCNKYDYVAIKCWKEKGKETRKCFKCNKEGYIVRDYKKKQSMKKWRIQEESDEQEDKEK